MVVKRYFADGVQQSGQAFFYSRDHLGSVRELSDGVAAVKARYDYEPYGKRSAISEDQVSEILGSRGITNTLRVERH
jgi:hypothetical protein